MSRHVKLATRFMSSSKTRMPEKYIRGKVVKVRIANKPDYSVLYLVHSDTFDFSLVVPFSDIGTTVFFSEAEALTARRKWLERK